MIRTLIVLLIALLPFQKGEGFRSRVSGVIFCQEGKGTIPLGGATLSLISGKDTLYTASDNSGRFSFSFPQAFEVTILAKYQGFEDYRETYQMFGDYMSVAIKMKQSKQQLDAAKIESEIPFVRREADTVIFNMAPLEKVEGDRALDLLLQIPGFGIQLNKLTVWGEFVDKAYVNGKLIYGDDPMSALQLLKAEEIKSVRVYDTQYMADKHRGLKHSKKRRVIDIQTFKKFFSAVDIQAQACAGSLFKKEDVLDIKPLRFSSGFDFDSNQEMRQIDVSVNAKNIDGHENGVEAVKDVPSALFSDNKYSFADCKYVQKWKDAEWGNSLSLRYKYDCNDRTYHDEEITDRIGTKGGLVPLHYQNSSYVRNRQGYHWFTLGAELHQTPLKDIEFDMDVIFDDGISDKSEKISSDSGSGGIGRQDQSSGTGWRGFSINPEIKWSNLDAKNGWTPIVEVSYNLIHNLLQSYTVDTLKSSTTRRYLEGSGGGNCRILSGEFSLKKVLSDTKLLSTELELFCDGRYENERKRMMTIDYLLPENGRTDYANSFDYSWNELKLRAGAGLTLSSGMGHEISVRAGVSSNRQLDVEAFPAEIRTPNSFTMPFADLSIRAPSRKGGFFLKYSLSDVTPALEQTRARIDNSNPLRLRIGNPDLKASFFHSVITSYLPRISSGGSSMEFNGWVVFRQNPIVDKIQYYSQAGSLNAWGVDYVIPAGGTLTGYENADLAYKVDCSATYRCRIKSLKGTLSSGLHFNLRHAPEYDGDCLNHVTGFGPEVVLSLSTTPVKSLRLNLSSSTSYTRDINASGTVISELMHESCTISAETRFLKHAFCNATYSADIYKYLGRMGVNTDMHDLGCALGYFFLDGKLAVSISGSDLLGKAMRYSTLASGSELTRVSTPSLGRYCMVNVAYRIANRY